MTSSDVWDEATAAGYDRTSSFTVAADVLTPRWISWPDWRGRGRPWSFAVGTGRVAIPLASRGVPVAGIELSPPMADQLHRRRPDLPVVVEYMAMTGTSPGRPRRRRARGPAAPPVAARADGGPLPRRRASRRLRHPRPRHPAGTSHHYWREDDGTARYAASNHRYVWPAEPDLMAQPAGLEHVRRVADWHGRPFTADSESAVSVWRKPA